MQSLDRLRREAKKLKRALAAGDHAALDRVNRALPGVAVIRHSDALHVIAREAGHESWPKLKLAHEIAEMDRAARAERLKVALYFGQGWVAKRLLAADPDLGDDNLGLQLALYRVDSVARALARDPTCATAMIGARSPILHLAFSQHYRSDPNLSESAIAIAELLVRNGADVNDSYPAEPGSEHRLSALYGALGHAGHLKLARWLLEQGADPNDNESLYHSTELGHTKGLRLLLEFGARPDGTNALARAMDFDDAEAVRLLLEAGADPNEGAAPHPSGQPPVVIGGLHQAARRMCSADIARLLIQFGADGRHEYNGHTAYALARMRGNRAVADVLEKSGQATRLNVGEAILAAAADGTTTTKITPDLLTDETRRILHRVLGFAGTLEHAKRLVELGIDPDWTDEQGMPAIHVAAWEGHAEVVDYLLRFGPDLELKNMYGGDLMGTVIHGSEFCPARAERDHLACAELILRAGSRLHAYDIEYCGNEDMSEFLRGWAEEHPDRVVNDI